MAVTPLAGRKAAAANTLVERAACREGDERIDRGCQSAYAARDVHLMFLTVDVKWDRYRSDLRFGDLLARCGFTTIGTRAGKAIER